VIEQATSGKDKAARKSMFNAMIASTCDLAMDSASPPDHA